MSALVSLTVYPMRLANITASILAYITEQNLLSMKSVSEFSAC